MVQTKISGFQIADRYGQQKERHTLEPEQFKTQEQRRNRTVCNAAEDRCHAAGCRHGRRESRNLSEQAAKRGSNKQSRNNLSSLESAPQSHGREYHFNQEGRGCCFPCHCLCHHVHPGSQIIRRAQKDGHQDDQQGAGNDAHPFVGNPFLIPVLRVVENHTEQNTDCRAEHSQHDCQDHTPDIHSRDLCDRKLFSMCADPCGRAPGSQRSHRAGNQSRIFHDAHADHFHGKYRGCQRSAEQRGERRAHPAHDHDLTVILIHLHPFSKSSSQTASQLKRRPFASCGTAKSMRQNCRYYDQRSHPQRHISACLDSFQHQIRTGVVRIQLIKHHYGQSGHRQKIQHPGVIPTKCRHIRDCQIEPTPDYAQDPSCKSGGSKPSQQDECSFGTFFQTFFYHLFHLSLPLPGSVCNPAFRKKQTAFDFQKIPSVFHYSVKPTVYDSAALAATSFSCTSDGACS